MRMSRDRAISSSPWYYYLWSGESEVRWAASDRVAIGIERLQNNGTFIATSLGVSRKEASSSNLIGNQMMSQFDWKSRSLIKTCFESENRTFAMLMAIIVSKRRDTCHSFYSSRCRQQHNDRLYGNTSWKIWRKSEPEIKRKKSVPSSSIEHSFHNENFNTKHH